MRVRIGILLSVGMLALLSSCNNYDKLLKGTDTAAQYREALRYYEKGKYHRASPLLQRVLPMARATRRADSVLYYLSNSHFKDGDYPLAGFYFEQLMENYPKSPFVEEATFFSAYCNYKSAPRPDLDQEYTVRAISGFQLYKELYPNSERRGETDELLKELHGRLLEKSYKAARLYYDREMYKAAVAALKYSLDKYPVGPYREHQLFLVLKSSYLLAHNSVREKQRERYQQAVDEYLTFISEFPSSKYAKEAANYYKKSMSFLGKNPEEQVLPSGN